MMIKRVSESWEPRLASIELWNDADQMTREAISRGDIVATVLALSSFLMLPMEIRTVTSLQDWLDRRGGSIETASEVARAVGKDDPSQVSTTDLKIVMRPQQAVPTPVKPPAPPMPNPPKDTPDATKTTREPNHLSVGSYMGGKDTSHAGELTPAVTKNATELITKVNELLKELGVERASITSGWRPPSYNEELRRRGIPAARKSQHITGQAVDIADPGQAISKMVMRDPSILERHSLWMEHPSKTKTWVHFDLGAGRDPRKNRDGTPRKNRVFMP